MQKKHTVFWPSTQCFETGPSVNTSIGRCDRKGAEGKKWRCLGTWKELCTVSVCLLP